MTTDANGELDPPGWTKKHWLDSKYGIGFIVLDIALTIVIVIVLVRWAPDPDSLVDTLLSVFGLVDAGAVSDPGFDVTRENILLFTLLGALGYVFTPLYKDIDRSAGEMLEYNFRLVGAIPLGFGIFLLSDYLLQNGGIGVLALSFLSGLYVNTFYNRVGAIADYVLPSEETGDDGDTEGTTDRDH